MIVIKILIAVMVYITICLIEKMDIGREKPYYKYPAEKENTL